MFSFTQPTSFTSAPKALVQVSPDVGANPNIIYPLGAETPFKALAPAVQQAFVEVYKSYKQPARESLTTLNRESDDLRDKGVEALVTSLQSISLATVQLSRKFEALLTQVNELHEQVRSAATKSITVLTVGARDIKARASPRHRYIGGHVILVMSTHYPEDSGSY